MVVPTETGICFAVSGIERMGYGRNKPLPYSKDETHPDNIRYSFFSLQFSIFSNYAPPLQVY